MSNLIHIDIREIPGTTCKRCGQHPVFETLSGEHKGLKSKICRFCFNASMLETIRLFEQEKREMAEQLAAEIKGR